MEGAAISGPVLLGLKMLENLTGPRDKTLTVVHETPVNIEGRLLHPTPEPKSIPEDSSTQKLIGVIEEFPNIDSTRVSINFSNP